MRKAGLDVLCVGETDDDALRIASEKEPEIVIIDVRLRMGMTGGQTAMVYFSENGLHNEGTKLLFVLPVSAKKLKRGA